MVKTSAQVYRASSGALQESLRRRNAANAIVALSPRPANLLASRIRLWFVGPTRRSVTSSHQLRLPTRSRWPCTCVATFLRPARSRRTAPKTQRLPSATLKRPPTPATTRRGSASGGRTRTTATCDEPSGRTRRESRGETVAARTASRWRTCSVRLASLRTSTRRWDCSEERQTVPTWIRLSVSQRSLSLSPFRYKGKTPELISSRIYPRRVACSALCARHASQRRIRIARCLVRQESDPDRPRRGQVARRTGSIPELRTCAVQDGES